MTSSRPAGRHGRPTPSPARSRHPGSSNLRRSSSGTRSAGTSTISHVDGVASGCGTWAGSALSTHRRPVTHAAPFPPVTGIGSTSSSTARRRSPRSRLSSLGRSLMSTSQAGSSRPSSTCRETTSPRSCATSSPNWPSASTSACSRGRERPCRSSSRHRRMFARCSRGSHDTPRSLLTLTVAPDSRTVTTRRRS